MNSPLAAAAAADPIAAWRLKIQRLSAQKSIPRYIAVEGPIGVGKTSLAKRLAEVFNYPLIQENETYNPFLDRFYTEGRHHALPTQLYFLLNRARQIGELSGHDLLGPNLVADFLIEKDNLFAELTLDEAEYKLYQQIHNSLQLAPPTPDLVIYLQAPPEILQQRIKTRGLDSEQLIQADYLRTLTERYTEFFYYYKQAPLMIVNAAEIDFAHNNRHFEALLEYIFQMEGSRQFFNPNPTLL
ncbi:MAG: deoxynucleoside kinase [Pseudomonadales bacterium]|nr:deoxynucleoside kinase [Pseudomonadales bacterium]